AVRRPRPHNGHSRDLQDRPDDSRGPLCVQPRARVDCTHQTSPVEVWKCDDPAFNRVENCSFSPTGFPVRNRGTMRFRTVAPVIHTPYDFYGRIFLNAWCRNRGWLRDDEGRLFARRANPETCCRLTRRLDANCRADSRRHPSERGGWTPDAGRYGHGALAACLARGPR